MRKFSLIPRGTNINKILKNNFYPRMVILVVIILFPFIDSASAQYVRKESFPTEKSRRQRYQLDDWLSYMNVRDITSVAMDQDYLYMGTKQGGILRYKYYEDEWDYPFTTSNGLPDNRILDVAYDWSRSLLWAVTKTDTAVFDLASQEWLAQSEANYWPYQFPFLEDRTPHSTEEIVYGKLYGRESLKVLPVFFANGDYTIMDDWILMDKYLREFPILGFFRDRRERIWFVVKDFGVGVGDLFIKRADFYEAGLPAIFPRDIKYQGDDLWIGGLARERGRPGIARWPANRPSWDYFEAKWISRLPDDNVNSILVDGDSVWFATIYGVSVYNTNKDKWKNFSQREGLVSNTVWDLAKSGEYIFAATDQGISSISLLTKRVVPVKDKRLINLPFLRLQEYEDTLWAATIRGIFRYAPSSDKWFFLPSKAAIQDMYITAVNGWKNEMWFASKGGIMWLNLRTGEWESFPQIAFEIPTPYTDIQVNSSSVWVATSKGLLKYDKVRKYWRLFTEEDGLLDNNCHRILLDGDYLWVTTNKGITQFYWNSPDRID